MRANPGGIVLYEGGLHKTTLGKDGRVGRKLALEAGYRFYRVRWPWHRYLQAKEGFTMLAALIVTWLMIRKIAKKHPGVPLILVGSSFGGWVATLLAANKVVSGLILVNPFMNFVGGYLETVFPHSKLMQWVAWLRLIVWKPFRYKVGEQEHFMPRSFLLNVGLHGYDVFKMAPKIKVPVLVIISPTDNLLALNAAETAKKFCAALTEYRRGVTCVVDDSVSHENADARLEIATLSKSAETIKMMLVMLSR